MRWWAAIGALLVATMCRQFHNESNQPYPWQQQSNCTRWDYIPGEIHVERDGTAFRGEFDLRCRLWVPTERIPGTFTLRHERG